MNAATQNRLFAEDGVTTEPVISVRGCARPSATTWCTTTWT